MRHGLTRNQIGVLGVLVCVLFVAGCGASKAALDGNQAAEAMSAIDFYNAGVGLLADGKSDLAEQQFKLALQADPSLAEADVNLGLIYLQNGWLDGAEQSTQTALQLLASSGRTVIVGATVGQTESLATLNLATIEFQRALAAEVAQDAQVGKAHTDQAIKYLRQAVALDPTNSKAQALLAQFGGGN